MGRGTGVIHLRIVVIGKDAAIPRRGPQITAHEIPFSHAQRAHHTEAAMLVRHVEVGVKGKTCAAFIAQDRGLIVDNVTVRMERVIDTFPDTCLAVHDLVFRVRGGRMGGDEGLAPAKAGHLHGTRACDHVVDVDIVAAFLQHETTGPLHHPAPVAHEEGTVIGADMLVRLKADDRAEMVQHGP